MRKIGLIGGVGWPSTLEYYRTLCQLSQRYHADQGCSQPYPTPEITIESLNLHFSINHRGGSDSSSWKVWDDYFNSAFKRLESSGATVLAIASITPHARFKNICKGINTPIVNAYDALGEFCQQNDFNNVLILGTLPTMTNNAMSSALSSYQINAFSPEREADRVAVTSVIQKLYENNTEGQSDHLSDVIDTLATESKQSNFAVCLACTELSTAYPEFIAQSRFNVSGVDYLNVSNIHAQKIFDACVI